jgi:hypothetical protein
MCVAAEMLSGIAVVWPLTWKQHSFRVRPSPQRLRRQWEQRPMQRMLQILQRVRIRRGLRMQRSNLWILRKSFTMR